jgi:hypothetical protein
MQCEQVRSLDERGVVAWALICEPARRFGLSNSFRHSQVVLTTHRLSSLREKHGIVAPLSAADECWLYLSIVPLS